MIELLTILVCVVAGITVGTVVTIRRYERRFLTLVDDKAIERFRQLVEKYDAAEREAMKVAVDVRHMTEQELKLVARSAQCVLWHADVADPGGDQLDWDLRIFAEELGEFVNIHKVPENYRVGAWYHGRSEEDMFRLADNATSALRGGERGYRQEFQCKGKDGEPVWFQEDVKIDSIGPGKWQLFGVSVDITERKKAEEQREKLLRELQEALAQVKQLRGMLPICSGCKKVRDDAGYWNQIDAYIRKHSDVEFSHSLCPECLEKMYPDYADKDGGDEADAGKP